MNNNSSYQPRSFPYPLLVASLLFLFSALSCDDESDSWQLVAEKQPGALLSIWGTSSSDVWTVGGDARDGTGPLVLHYDGEKWQRIETGETQGNLWWVFGFEDGPVFMGGDAGVILRYENDTFTKTQTPSNGRVFGIWGASPEDMWAVGSLTPSSGGFAWRLAGDTWTEEATLPDEAKAAAVWKVNGRSANDAWLVGSDGVAMYWDGSSLALTDTGSSTSLFTVHSNDNLYVATGGLASGVILEKTGANWVDSSPEGAYGLTGVFIGPDDHGYAVGQYGSVFERKDGTWTQAELGFYLDQGLHATWIDPEGDMWAVGGQVLSTPLTDGVIIHYGAKVHSDGLTSP